MLNYSRTSQPNGKRYDQLLGGDGNLLADLRDLSLDFFYAKYQRIGFGWFDQVTATYSFNSQHEERVNQGGNGNPKRTITQRARADERARLPGSGHQADWRAEQPAGRRRVLPRAGARAVHRLQPGDAGDVDQARPRARQRELPQRRRIRAGHLRRHPGPAAGAAERALQRRGVQVARGRQPGRQRPAALAGRLAERVERLLPRGRRRSRPGPTA